jgi:membrane protease YdiL (CAAX protease family)
MAENAPMPFWMRLALLGMAVAMPLLAGAVLVFFAATTVMVGSNDRALVWAEGERGQIEAMRQRVADSPWFPQGRTRAAGTATELPSTCSDAAYEFSFGGLRAEQAQAARSTLESYARDAGARLCQTNLFIINEHPDPVATPTRARLASALLQSALIPCGIALLVYWAFARQLQLQPNAGGQRLGAQVAIGVIAGVAGASALAVLSWFLRMAGGMAQEPMVGNFADLGPYLLVAILFSEPLLEELAFRAWLIPIAERAIGSYGAAALSATLFAAVHLPFGAREVISAMVVGGVLATTYLRSRSLLACVMANALMAGGSLAMAG